MLTKAGISQESTARCLELIGDKIEGSFEDSQNPIRGSMSTPAILLLPICQNIQTQEMLKKIKGGNDEPSFDRNGRSQEPFMRKLGPSLEKPIDKPLHSTSSQYVDESDEDERFDSEYGYDEDLVDWTNL